MLITYECTLCHNQLCISLQYHVFQKRILSVLTKIGCLQLKIYCENKSLFVLVITCGLVKNDLQNGSGLCLTVKETVTWKTLT